jgi:hypothetical protein
MGGNTVGIYLKTIKLLVLAFQAPPPCLYRCHHVAHFPSCPFSIPKISSPPPPCPHPCWLSRCPCCHAITSSCSLDAPPLPCDALPPVVPFSSRLPLVCQLVVMSCILLRHLYLASPFVAFAGIVRCRQVKMGVKTMDMCLSG